jgi:poly-gamma-glutamate synthesis protein (capsule biosynthesis protein)
MTRMRNQDHSFTRRELLRRGGRLGASTLAAASGAAFLTSCGERSIAAGPTPTATLAPTPTATPDTRPVTIAITGDIMLGRSITPRMRQSADLYPFNGVANALKRFDVTVGNLECVVSRLGSPIPGKQYTFEADPLGFARLQAAGYDIVSVANNHSGDYGKTAFMDELTHLGHYGLTALGGGANLHAAHQPVIRKVRETTLGLLAYCEIEPNGFAATASTPGHAWLDAALMTADIKATRPLVDYLIVFTHWGIEYQPLQSFEQDAMARIAIDAGADFVVGAHPHVIQPSSSYRGKPIVYSLGNFVFDEMPTEDVRRGNVLSLTIHRGTLLNWSLRTSRLGADWAPVWLS